jgi:hypothetical protein
MTNVPSDARQVAPNNSDQKDTIAPTASSATTFDAYTKIASRNPKFKVHKSSGTGFVIVGAKP